MHSADIPSPGHWDNLARTISSLTNKSIEDVMAMQAKKFDVSGDMLVADMDEGGIDKAVVMPNDLGLMKYESGEGKYSIREINRIFAEATQRHPGRLLAFVGVDPRRPEAVSILEQGMKEWGMKGLKLNPACGFYPDDREWCYPLYEKAQELGAIVLCHTGPEGFPFHTKYCEPKYLAEVAVDFPDLKIIMAHAGYCWWPEAATIASLHRNVYLDLAQWQPTMVRQPQMPLARAAL